VFTKCHYFFRYNFDKHQPIAIAIFLQKVTESVISYRVKGYFIGPSQLISAKHYLVKQETEDCIFSRKDCISLREIGVLGKRTTAKHNLALSTKNGLRAFTSYHGRPKNKNSTTADGHWAAARSLMTSVAPCICLWLSSVSAAKVK